MIVNAIIQFLLNVMNGIVQLIPVWPASGWQATYPGLTTALGVANMFAPVSEMLQLLTVVFAGVLVYLGVWAILKLWQMVRG